MIHTIKSLCQVTENSSNRHFWLIDLNTLRVSPKETFSDCIPFLTSYCSLTISHTQLTNQLLTYQGITVFLNEQSDVKNVITPPSSVYQCNGSVAVMSLNRTLILRNPTLKLTSLFLHSRRIICSFWIQKTSSQ